MSTIITGKFMRRRGAQLLALAEHQSDEEKQELFEELGNALIASAQAAVRKRQLAEETKQQKFHRLTPGRLSKTIDRFRFLKKMSDKHYYEYTEQEAANLVRPLFNELSDLTAALRSRGKLSCVFANEREQARQIGEWLAQFPPTRRRLDLLADLSDVI